MRLIGLAVVLILGLLTPFPARAQAPHVAKTPKVGILTPAREGDPVANAVEKVFQDALKRLGWLEGQNVVFEPDIPVARPIDSSRLLANWST